MCFDIKWIKRLKFNDIWDKKIKLTNLDIKKEDKKFLVNNKCVKTNKSTSLDFQQINSKNFEHWLIMMTCSSTAKTLNGE